MIFKSNIKQFIVVLTLIIPSLSWAENWTCEGNGTISRWTSNNEKLQVSTSTSFDLDVAGNEKSIFAEIKQGGAAIGFELQRRGKQYKGQRVYFNMSRTFTTHILEVDLENGTFKHLGYFGHPNRDDMMEARHLVEVHGTCSKDEE